MEDWEIEKMPLGIDCESNMTVGLFIADIFIMVLNLFILFGIAIASLLIWLVGEEEFDVDVPM
jgi:hypothetical protein